MSAALNRAVLRLLLMAAFSGHWSVAEASTPAEIRKTLFTSSYNRQQPPPEVPVVVHIHLNILNVELYAHSNGMKIDCLIYISWEDSRLSWPEPDRMIPIHSNEIWTPDIRPFSRWSTDTLIRSQRGIRCLVSGEGVVECMPPAELFSHCTLDLTRWPYSRHNCSLHISSQLTSQQLTIEATGHYLGEDLKLTQWEDVITEIRTQEIDGKSNLIISVELQKNSKSETAFIITPAFVLSALSAGTWLLPAIYDVRLVLATFSVLLHNLVIDNLSNILPENGDSTPMVVLLYRDLLLVAAASLVGSVVARGLSTTRHLPATSWLPKLLASGPARWLVGAPKGSFGVLQDEDDAEGLVSEDGPAAEVPPGPHLALLLDRLGLAFTVIVCVIILATRLPG